MQPGSGGRPRDLRHIVFRRRDALGRYLGYRSVRHVLRNLGLPLPICCACCGYLTLDEYGYGFCVLCRWFDDSQDDPNADEAEPGPNHPYSLSQRRAFFAESLCAREESDPDFAIEQALVERKKPIIALFDAMTGALCSEEFIDAFADVQRLIGELSAERNRLFEQRARERT